MATGQNRKKAAAPKAETTGGDRGGQPAGPGHDGPPAGPGHTVAASKDKQVMTASADASNSAGGNESAGGGHNSKPQAEVIPDSISLRLIGMPPPPDPR